MKQILTISVCCLALVALTTACGQNCRKAKAEAAEKARQEQAAIDSVAAAEKAQQTMAKLASLPEEPVFDIITTMGTITVKLYKETPKHRDNFAKLALEGFYDGIQFHRVIYGFMIQGGDPLTKDPANKARFGTGDPDYTIPAEILPSHNHKKGALAAARRGDAVNPFRESSGSQFYIVQDPYTCAQLDGQYTVFGETISGLDVVDKIARVDTDGRDCPLSEVKIITITLDESI